MLFANSIGSKDPETGMLTESKYKNNKTIYAFVMAIHKFHNKKIVKLHCDVCTFKWELKRFNNNCPNIRTYHLEVMWP